MLDLQKEPSGRGCVNIFRFISQKNNTNSVGRHFNTEDHRGLSDVELYVLQFGREEPDSAAFLAIRLILELLWIHKLRSTTLWASMFSIKEMMMPLLSQSCDLSGYNPCFPVICLYFHNLIDFSLGTA